MILSKQKTFVVREEMVIHGKMFAVACLYTHITNQHGHLKTDSSENICNRANNHENHKSVPLQNNTIYGI